MEKKKIRIDYIDTAKALLIILVVLGHILIILIPEYDKLFYSAIESLIYTFHMPAFFIIHGILFNIEKWRNTSIKEYLLKRVYSLIVPYLFFEIVDIIWKVVFYDQHFTDGLYYLCTVRCNVGADWFLPAMFIGCLLFFMICKFFNTIYAIVSVPICFTLPMFFPENQLLIVLGRGMLAYGFIVIGYTMKTLFLSKKIEKLPILALSFGTIIILAAINLKFGGNDFYTCMVNNPFTLAAGGIVGTVLILGISRILHCKILTYIGKYSLIIMGTHQLAIYAMTSLLPELYGSGILAGICMFGVIIVFEIMITWILERYLPVCVGRKRKSDC